MTGDRTESKFNPLAGLGARVRAAVAVVLALSVYAAAAADAPTDPTTTAGSKSAAPGDVVPTDEELADLFLLSTNATSASWRGSILVRVSNCSDKFKNDPELVSSLRSVLRPVERATGLKFKVIQVPRASVRSQQVEGSIHLQVCANGERFIAPQDAFLNGFKFTNPPGEDLGWRDAAVYRAKAKGQMSGRRLIFGGIAGFRSVGDRIVEAQCVANFHYKRQYIYFDLPARLLRSRQRGAELTKYVPEKFVTSFYSMESHGPYGAEYDLSPPPHTNDLRALLPFDPDTRDGRACLKRDFEQRRRILLGQCISEALGISWGIKLRADQELKMLGPSNSTERLRFMARDVLWHEQFVSSRYQAAQRHWLLLLSIKYRDQIEGGDPVATRSQLLAAVQRRRELSGSLDYSVEGSCGNPQF